MQQWTERAQGVFQAVVGAPQAAGQFAFHHGLRAANAGMSMQPGAPTFGSAWTDGSCEAETVNGGMRHIGRAVGNCIDEIGGMTVVAIASAAIGGGGGLDDLPYCTEEASESITSNYSHLQDPEGIGSGLKYSSEQIYRIYEENSNLNSGVLKCDNCGKSGVRCGRSTGGQKLPADGLQVDHIVPRNPKDPAVLPGSNSYSNARVVHWKLNNIKRNY